MVHDVVSHLFALRQMEKNHQVMKQALITIQKTLRMAVQRKKLRKIIRAVNLIKATFKMIPLRKEFKLKLQKIRIIQKYWKPALVILRKKKKQALIIKLQAHMRMRIQYRKYIIQRDFARIENEEY